MLVPQGWADLPADLLQSITFLLGTPHETLAFAATCRHWYAAFLSCLSAINLFALFPPLLLRPKLPDSNLYSEHFVDPTNTAASVRCRVPWRTVNKMDYIGYSYGNIIYCYKKKCHLFDVFTGAMTKSPRLIIDKRDYPTFGALTAPPASADSSVLVQVGCSLFWWKVGSTSWLKLCQTDIPFDHLIISRLQLDEPIFQVISFKGEIFAIDSSFNLFKMFLEPRFRLRKLSVGWAAAKFDGYMWFVVCDDMLLLIGPANNRYQAVHLDLSSRRKRMVKVERLENWAVFVGGGTKSQAFACKNPERWGGRSNCIYLCGVDGEQPWCTVQLGEEVKEPDYWERQYRWRHLRHVEDGVTDLLSTIWVFPGVFSRI
ncbi:unnamed protein product [Urochloa decumbens]|uniref:KIB1-4 beta-propeller domain-containing protein n=1 Tax=Urochloa decumbens TaxID=240449 RepID=A0ABC9DWR7_9POAL